MTTDLPSSPIDTLRWRAMREPGSMKPGYDSDAEEPPWREETFAHDPDLPFREGGAADALAELARTATAPLLSRVLTHGRASRLYVVRDGAAMEVPGTDWQHLFDRDVGAYQPHDDERFHSCGPHRNDAETKHLRIRGRPAHWTGYAPR